MRFFGQLADKKVAEEIVAELHKRGISAGFEFRPELSQFVLYINSDDEAEFELATDSFRVKLGFPRQYQPDPEWQAIKSIPLGAVTKTIIIICIAVFLLGLKDKNSVYLPLLFDIPNGSSFSAILSGQAWRIWTPIFIHFGFMHILFNLMWFKDLGSIFERELGPRSFVLMIFLIGGLSNLGQYLLKGPMFGGMSGVVYGLLGFLWVVKKLDSSFAFSLPQRDIYLMLGWFVLCLTNMIGQIANVAHAVGLSVGMFWALFYCAGKFNEKKSLWIGFFASSFAISALTIAIEIAGIF